MQGTATSKEARGYAIALAAVVAATGLRWMLQPVLGDDAPFTLYYAAVFVAAWLGGVGPAAVALVASLLLGGWLFVVPQAADSARAAALLAIYASIEVAAGVAGTVLRNSQLRLRAGLALPQAATTLGAVTPPEPAPPSPDTIDRARGEPRGDGAAATDIWAATHALLQDVPVPVVCLDANGRPRLRNRLAEDDPPPLDDALVRRALAGETVEGESAVHGMDQGERYIATRYIPHKATSGNVDGVLVVARDDTRTRRAEAALELVHRKVGDFLSVLGHELRNPITAIAAASRLLGEASLAPEQRERHRQTIQRQSQRLNRMIEDLLDTSRISRGTIELKPVDVALRPLLEDIADELALRSLDAEVEINLVLVAPTAGVQGDQRRLKQALENVIQNAIEASGPRQTVDVTLAQHDDRLVVVRVRDYGTGVPADVLDRMYQPFARAEYAPHGGLGLGLSIAKRLTELHGGHVDVRAPDDGPGTIVELRLPLIAAAVAVPDVPPVEPRAEHEHRCGRVLIVDDEVDSAEALAAYLGLERHEVRVAYSGVDGIGLAATFRPDVVICDIGLPPPLSGMDVAQALRGQADAPTVIAFSGYAEDHDPARSRAAGFFLHIVKPSTPEAIAQAVQKALAAR